MKYPVLAAACLFSLLSLAGSAFCDAQDSATPPAENPKPAETARDSEPKPA